MKPKVFSTLPMKQEVEDYIRTYCELEIWTDEEPISRDTLLQKVGNIEGLYTSSGQCEIDEELLEQAPHLKVVSNMSVGHNNFHLADMKKHNVIGTNTPYVLDETVADLTFALILSTARRICELDQYVKGGNWEPMRDEVPFYGTDVNGSTLGIIGMGRIGEAVARRAKLGFQMDVIYYNRSRREEVEENLGVNYRELNHLLQEADFIVLLTPLTDETYQLIGEKEFKLMKKSAFFINVSRGKTIDERALIQALKNKDISGAGLDVYEQEPVEKDNELLQMRNVVTVPHIGSATQKTSDMMAMRAAKNLVNALSGQGPVDAVTD